MQFILTFRREQLDLLAPAGATVDTTWVVCFAHRPRVIASGIPAWGGIDGWHPTIPFPSQQAAEAFAEKFARASLDDDDELDWSPVYDDQGNPTEAFELWVTHADGTESQTDVAIAPLGMLAHD